MTSLLMQASPVLSAKDRLDTMGGINRSTMKNELQQQGSVSFSLQLGHVALFDEYEVAI